MKGQGMRRGGRWGPSFGCAARRWAKFATHNACVGLGLCTGLDRCCHMARLAGALDGSRILTYYGLALLRAEPEICCVPLDELSEFVITASGA